MLELAHKLADSDSKFFGGWVLAGVESASTKQPCNKKQLKTNSLNVLQLQESKFS